MFGFLSTDHETDKTAPFTHVTDHMDHGALMNHRLPHNREATRSTGTTHTHTRARARTHNLQRSSTTLPYHITPHNYLFSFRFPLRCLQAVHSSFTHLLSNSKPDRHQPPQVAASTSRWKTGETPAVPVNSKSYVGLWVPGRQMKKFHTWVVEAGAQSGWETPTVGCRNGC